MPDLADINQVFVTYKNQFTEPVYEETIFPKNPYIALFARREFAPEDGLTPEVITSTCELPTSYPDNLAALALSDGTGSSCDIEATTVQPGYLNRNYHLEVTAFDTPVVCLTDLQFSWQAAQTMANFQYLLTRYTSVKWADLYRVWNVRMLDHKVSTLAAGAVSEDENSDGNFNGVATPTTALSWDHLNPLYDQAIQEGADNFAVGYAGGQPF